MNGENQHVKTPSGYFKVTTPKTPLLSQQAVTSKVMQRRCVEAESITHKYCDSSTKPKFYKNTRLIGKIIEKISLANFYSKTHIL